MVEDDLTRSETKDAQRSRRRRSGAGVQSVSRSVCCFNANRHAVWGQGVER